ncbi:MAG: hypothetical protein Q9217_005290 [Psora testacea]
MIQNSNRVEVEEDYSSLGMLSQPRASIAVKSEINRGVRIPTTTKSKHQENLQRDAFAGTWTYHKQKSNLTPDKMLAARDQENLVFGHQAAAASKPLNQGTRQLPPKTPGNRVPKTPIKLPLNDENDNGGFGAAKTGVKANNAGKNAFVTPMGPKNRAPLGMKTTNAKTKNFQKRAPPAQNEFEKSVQKGVSARKPKPRVSHTETTKLEDIGDEHILEERDIEYMPPRSKDLPDIPDDIPDLDLSMFTNGNIFEGAMSYFATRPGADGLSILEREEKRRDERWAIMDRKNDAKMQRDMDSLPIPCTHYPECPGELCKDTIRARKDAQAEYEKAIAIIDAEAAPKKQVKGPIPSTIKSKAAATALAQPKLARPIKDPVKKYTAPPGKIRATTTPQWGLKKTPLPTNPSPMRHTAAIAASKTTIGHAKGRVVSTRLGQVAPAQKQSRFTPFEQRDTSLAPAEYYARWGEPPKGSDMWLDCWRLGILECSPKHQDMDELDDGNSLDEMLREDALDGFQLTLEE